MPHTIPFCHWACRLACKTIPALFLVIAAVGSGGCATCILWNTDLSLKKEVYYNAPIKDLDSYEAHIPTMRAVCVVDETHLGIVTAAPKETGKKNAIVSVKIPKASERNGDWSRTFDHGPTINLETPSISATAKDPTTWDVRLGSWDPKKCNIHDSCLLVLTDSPSSDEWSNLLAPGQSLDWIMIPEGVTQADLPTNDFNIKTLVINYGKPRIPYNGPITYTTRILLTPPAIALDIVTSPIQIPGYLFLRSLHLETIGDR